MVASFNKLARQHVLYYMLSIVFAVDYGLWGVVDGILIGIVSGRSACTWSASCF